MATRRYGISTGENISDVTEDVGAAVSSDTVELTIDLAAIGSRENAIKAIDIIRGWIIQGQWPPA